MQENVDIMIKVNPEFNIQIFDCDERREFIKNNFPEDILIAYDTLKPGAYKADLWRLCVLYVNGGIYVDIKLKCINNFKFISLTEREYLVLDIQPGHGLVNLWNGLIVSKPKNDLLLKCINKINENVKNKYYGFNYLSPTGPGLLGEQYIKMLRENESTIEEELHKLELCFYNTDMVLKIIFNNVAILEYYKEYRSEQKKFAKTKHYAEIYGLKQIYNEDLVEYFNYNKCCNKCNKYCNKCNKYCNKFNKYCNKFNNNIVFILCIFFAIINLIFIIYYYKC